MKTISTRNLALSSRCLQLVRRHFESLLASPPSAASAGTGVSLSSQLVSINVAKHIDSLSKAFISSLL